MARTHLIHHKVSKIGKYLLIFITSLVLIVWGLETPAGILGKLDAVGYAVCHRIDVRSFHIGIRQLPLCARCSGQYVGAMIGLLFQAVYSRRRSGFPPRRVFVILGILGLAYFVDGLNSYLYLPPFLELFPNLPHLYIPTNTLRLLTGSGMGIVISVILYPALTGSIYANPDIHPVMGGIKPLLCLTGLCVIADLLVLTGSSYILYPAALISAVGVIVLLSFAYTIVILRIFKKENTYDRFVQISLPLLAGFMITMLQTGLVDLIRYIMTGTWSGFMFG